MIVLHPSEARQLVAAVDIRDPFGIRDRALLVFALHTGLRVSELCALDISAVSVNGAPREALHVPSGKGRARVVPMNQTARAAVAQLLDFNHRRGFSTAPGAPLFSTRMHEPMNVRAVQRMVEALREKAQLDVPATPHSLRHTAASTLMSSDSNLRVVQEILGHRNIGTTEIYSHPTREDLCCAAERMAERGVKL